MLHIAGFIISAFVIFYTGKNLSYYGDMIAVKTKLSKGWIGLILLASVTSLPELMVGISSSALVESADLAVGDILGSCAFNLGILAILDACVPKNKTLFELASPNHMLNAALGILLISLVGFALFLPSEYAVVPWIGLSSLAFVVVYLLSVRVMYLNEKKNHLHENEMENQPYNQALPTLGRIIVNYAIFAAILILAALTLPFFAKHIAELTGLGNSFTGTFFLAITTSLPEIAVSIAAVRMGSIDLSVGNLLGSNIFNVLILAIDDIFYTKGFILKDASDYHIISVLSTIMMSAIVVIGLSFKSPGKRFFLAIDAATIFLIYLVNLFLLYHFTSR